MLIKRGKANCNNSSIQQKRKPSLSCTMMLPMLSSSSSSPRHRGSPRGDRSSASRSKMNSDSTIVMLSSSDNNERRGTRSSSSSLFTPTQACALAALCSSMAAAVTALMAFCFFSSGSSLSSSGYDFYSDHMVASTTRSIISRRRVRSLTSDANSNKNGALQEMAINNVTSGKPESLGALKAVVSEKLKLVPPQISRFPLSTLPEPVDDLSSPRPHIAWLMSFPNSGTSFTLHLTREASNCTTATNYALEGDIKDKPSVPAIPGPVGEKGPFLELIPNRHTNVPGTILTKTHCKGICTRDDCGPGAGIETVRSFLHGCVSGLKAIEENGKIVTHKVAYDPKLVKKAIHIFRHPLDNIVARFHLDYHDQTAAGNKKFAQSFPRNATGFHRWCAWEDKTRFWFKTRYTDHRMRELMKGFPCINEFYRYVQWHNLAFDLSRYLNLPTMMLHYHEYSENLDATRDRILDWLELPHAGPGEPFHTGKVYRHYYSTDQRRAVRAFIEEFASAETWHQLKDYDFDMETKVTTTT